MRARPWAVVFAMCLAVPLGATAQPSAGAVEEARRHADAGETALAERQFQRALQEYQAAYDLFPNSLLLVNVARAQSGLGKNRDAIATLGRVLEDAGLDPARRAEVDTELRRLRGLVVELTISVTPAGAHVSVNGEDAGQAPLPGPVLADPGTIQVLVTHDGHRSGRWSGNLEAGAQRPVAIALEPTTGTADPGDSDVAPPPDGGDVVAPPPRTSGGSSGLVLATGIGAAATGIASLSIGTLLLARCGGFGDCAEYSEGTLTGLSVVADILGGVAIVCAGVFVYALATSGDAEQAAETALSRPGILRF